jgi:ribosomal protein L28
MFVCVLCLPRVEAGKNTSTASRKRRRKGNPVVSGETVPADLREG